MGCFSDIEEVEETVLCVMMVVGGGGGACRWYLVLRMGHLIC